jgi:hypothetical protein
MKHCYRAASVSTVQVGTPLYCTQVRGSWESRTPQNYPRRSLIFITSHIAVCRMGGIEKYNYGFIVD